MNRLDALNAFVDKATVSATYAGRTHVGIVVAVDTLGRDVLVAEENGVIQWIPSRLVVPVAEAVAAEFVDPHDIVQTDHLC